MNHTLRIGRFTSSGIGALMTMAKDQKSFGKPALNYIQEKTFERRLGRSLNSEFSAKPTSWGNLVEALVFEKLGMEYTYCSQRTIEHPEFPFWAGSPDLVKEDTVCDVKSPFTMKSFCKMADCKTIEELRDAHDEGDTYYWQLVSNSILTGKKYAELIIFCPYLEDLDQIREMASNYEGDQNDVAWIAWAANNTLPFVLKGGFYQSINTIRFEVPKGDKAALMSRAIQANAMIEEALKLPEIAA